MKDYYYILGITKGASLEEIKSAYRKLSQKFHPDKNDGDPFFSERFKDINEAYETLSNPNKRRKYDSNYGGISESDTISRSNFVPLIDYFRVNKEAFEYDDKLTFTWRTINATNVIIRPFGEVEPIGQRTFQIKDFKHRDLTFSLVAENRNIERYTESSITLKNRTFENFYNQILTEIKKSRSTDSNFSHKDAEETIRNKIHTQYSEKIGLLQKKVNRYELRSKRFGIFFLLIITLLLLSFIYSRANIESEYASDLKSLNEEIKILEIRNTLLTDSLFTLNIEKKKYQGSSQTGNRTQTSYKNLSNDNLTNSSQTVTKKLANQSIPSANNILIMQNLYIDLGDIEWTQLYDGVYVIESVSIKNKSARMIKRVKYSYTVLNKHGNLMETGKWMIPSDGSDEMFSPGQLKRVPFRNEEVRVTLDQQLILKIDDVIMQ